MNSYYAEQAFQNLINKAGFGKMKLSFISIIKIANKHNSSRVNNVLSWLEKEGYRSPEDTPIDLLIDKLLAIDSYFSLPTKSGKEINIGVDVTLNPNEVRSKFNKLKSMETMLKEQGFHNVLVVEFAVKKSFKDWTKEDVQSLKRQLVVAIQATRNNKHFANSITLSLE